MRDPLGAAEQAPHERVDGERQHQVQQHAGDERTNEDAPASTGSPSTTCSASAPTEYRIVTIATESNGACVRSRPVVSP